jgi:hypothetical protein
MTAVFDVTNRAVYISPSNMSALSNCVLPDSDILVGKLKDSMRVGFGDIEVGISGSTNISSSPQPGGNAEKKIRTRPLYDVSAAQKLATSSTQNLMHDHLINVLAKTKNHVNEVTKLKNDRINGIDINEIEEEKVLFGGNFNSDRGRNSTPDNNSISGVTSDSEGMNHLTKQSSLRGFFNNDNNKSNIINLLHQPLVGEPFFFFRKFCATQIFAEYALFPDQNDTALNAE